MMGMNETEIPNFFFLNPEKSERFERTRLESSSTYYSKYVCVYRDDYFYGSQMSLTGS